ncbi:TetR/AcrR family transcriptional regulator [Thalassotalea fusca]
MVALRDPDQTRARILEVTANEMRRHGFKATSLSEIIKNAGISKGALYHHFANKQELGYATFSEVFMKENNDLWQESVLDQDDPIEALCSKLNCLPDNMSEQDMECGCPINTIAQEMSADDEGFRELTQQLYNSMCQMFTKALTKCQQQGLLKDDVNIERSALFIWASMQGISSVAKVSRDINMMSNLTLALQDFLRSLKK